MLHISIAQVEALRNIVRGHIDYSKYKDGMEILNSLESFCPFIDEKPVQEQCAWETRKHYEEYRHYTSCGHKTNMMESDWNARYCPYCGKPLTTNQEEG